MSACRNENVHLSLGLGITKGQIGQIKSHFVNRHLGSSQKVLRSRNGKIMMISIWISVTEQSLAMTLAQSLLAAGKPCHPMSSLGQSLR